MGFERIRYSKSRVSKAGDNIANGNASDQDWEVLANWRSVHTYVLNTFQANIRRLIDGKVHVFAQRLKRKNTIINKLATGRAVDLASMHDIAGCRIICDTLHDLNIARNRIHNSKARHIYLSDGKYDYLSNPKGSGYRGRHDVFSHKVSGLSGSQYNGLKVEIQYRTKIQHAWATALEISDIIDNTSVKFSSGINPDKERFFCLASEYLARKYEQMTGCLPGLTDQDILYEMVDIENRIHMLARLRKARSSTKVPNSRNIILHFTESKLIASGFRTSNLAIEKLNQLEQDHPGHDIVYVRANQPRAIQNAFTNYFKNSQEFLRLMPKL